jgi:3-hydroxybutyryl-CoA dehydratase
MKFAVGQSFKSTHTFSQGDFDEFARLSGDDNPIHVDPAFAARTRFGRTVSHGMLLYGVICGVLSRHFPGAVQLEQRFTFPAPTYTGEEMTINLTIIELLSDNQLRLTTTITNPQGQLTCEGETVIRVPYSEIRNPKSEI